MAIYHFGELEIKPTSPIPTHMAYTHFGELEIKPTSPIPTHMAYTHFGELEIKPTSPIPTHIAYTHFGELEIKPTSPIPTYTHFGELEIKPTTIPLPIPNHGIHHFGEIQTFLPPTHLPLGVYFGSGCQSCILHENLKNSKGWRSEGTWVCCWGCVHMWKEGGQSSCCGSIQP
jgi:hypothetical protein